MGFFSAAGRAMARHGLARPGAARHGNNTPPSGGEDFGDRPGKAARGLGKARQGMARHGSARQGEAWARQPHGGGNPAEDFTVNQNKTHDHRHKQ
jgi:hypothetical protein